LRNACISALSGDSCAKKKQRTIPSASNPGKQGERPAHLLRKHNVS